MKTVANVTAGQVSISIDSLEEDEDESGVRHGFIDAEVAPSDGAYKGGKFKFKIYPASDYPTLPPEVRCVTDIYHPNIDSDDQEDEGTNICVSLLEVGEWDANMNLEHCIQAILFLFYNPNWGDALSPFFSADLSQEDFEENVKISLEGGEVEGRFFERNYGLSANQDNTDGSKLTNQEIELNNINTALSNTVIDSNETVDTEPETKVMTDEAQDRNTDIPTCDTAQINIEMPTEGLAIPEVELTAPEVDQYAQEVDLNTQEIVREDVEQIKCTGFLHRSLSVGDSPREGIIPLDNVFVSVETIKKLLTNTVTVNNKCDNRTNKTEEVVDGDNDEQEQLLPNFLVNTQVGKDQGVVSPGRRCCVVL